MSHTIHDLHREFEAAFNAADEDALTALYEDGAMLAAEPGQHVSGHEAIKSTLGPFMAAGMKIELTTVYVMERDNLALCGCDFVLTGGTEPMRGRTSELARRQPDGKWRYAIDNPWSA